MKWLKNYFELEMEIHEMEWEIKRSKVELKRWKEGGDLFHKSKFETALYQQRKVQHSIELQEAALKDKKNVKDSLLKLIDTFEGLDNQIMKMKYIEGKTLEVIAEELHYNASHIYNKHAAIMKRLEFAEKIREGEQWVKALD